MIVYVLPNPYEREDYAMDERVNISEENVTALIEVKIAPQLGEGYDRIAERIYQYEEVESLYLMSGSYDLLVTITAKSLKAAAAFVYEHLAAIAGVTGTATSFVMKKYKEQNIILAPHPEQEERIDFI